MAGQSTCALEFACGFFDATRSAALRPQFRSLFSRTGAGLERPRTWAVPERRLEAALSALPRAGRERPVPAPPGRAAAEASASFGQAVTTGEFRGEGNRNFSKFRSTCCPNSSSVKWCRRASSCATART